MLIFWSLVRNSVVLAVYLLFSVACFLTVHEHYRRCCRTSYPNRRSDATPYRPATAYIRRRSAYGTPYAWPRPPWCRSPPSLSSLLYRTRTTAKARPYTSPSPLPGGYSIRFHFISTVHLDFTKRQTLPFYKPHFSSFFKIILQIIMFCKRLQTFAYTTWKRTDLKL